MTNKLLTACLILVSLTTLNACKENKKKATKQETESTTTPAKTSENSKEQASQDGFVERSVDDTLAKKLKNYITTTYLSKSDLRAIDKNERKFQFYQIDLNNDGKMEVFVNFITPYFCGTGGCTLLLLSDQLKPITEFTVTNTPLYVKKETKNGWRVILTRSEEDLKELIFHDGTYPSNPSMIDKKASVSPNDKAEVLFDEHLKSKTHSF